MKFNDKPFQLYFFVIPLSIFLAACGGGGGGSDDASQSNSAPTISGVSETIVRAETNYTFVPSANDPDNDGLIFEIENKPDWAAFDMNTGELSGMPTEGDVGIYDEIQISVTDGAEQAILPVFSITVMYAPVGRDDIQIAPDATRTETDDGYDIIGAATITVGNVVTEFNNADLQFEFDEEGNLLDLVGITDLPPVLSENLSLETSVQAIVGLYTGAEINARNDIGPESEPGILLKDDFKYLVYFLDASIDLVFHPNTGDDIEIPLEVAGTRVLILSDPTDPMFYYFGQIAGTDLGFGYSYNSHFPWVPQFDAESDFVFDPFQPFDGQVILKGSFPMGVFGAFETFSIHGEAICRPPQLFDCGKPTVSGLLASIATSMVDGGIDPSQQVQLGFNGGADLQFTLFGFDLFSYELLDVSATAEVGTDRQAIALQGVLQPGNAEQPSWFQFQTAPDSGVTAVANLFANVETSTGEGDFGLSFFGEIDSFFPEARLAGTIDINAQGVQMAGVIDDPENPIAVTATVDENQLSAGIQMTYDVNGNVDTMVNEAFDRVVADVQQALVDLDNAIDSYNGAVSLDGFRQQIPSIVDDAIAVLNGIPQRVYDDVYDNSRAGMNSWSTVVAGVTFYARDYLDVNANARASANTTRNVARTNVSTRIAELETLRTEAERAEDTPAFRTALKNAINQLVSRAQYSQSVLVRRTIDFGLFERSITFYETTLRYTVIDNNTRSDLQVAAANVDDIGPAQTVMINTEEYVNTLPTEEMIESTREDVNNGARSIPQFRGAGYTIVRDGAQSAYVDLGSDRIEITFNPLDPATIIENLGDLIADALL